MSIEDVLDDIMGIVVFIFAVAFAVFTFKTGIRYDRALNEATHNKASSRYTLAYWDSENVITPAQVYADIMQESEEVSLLIDGHILNAEYLKQARTHDPDGIRRLMAGLTASAYRKIVQFDSAGNVVAINYKRGE